MKIEDPAGRTVELALAKSIESGSEPAVAPATLASELAWPNLGEPLRKAHFRTLDGLAIETGLALRAELQRQRAALGGRGLEALPIAPADELLQHAARCLLAYELRKAAGGG